MPRSIPLSRALQSLIHTQDGLVTARQLAEHGLDRGYSHRRVSSRRWQRLLPGVLLTNTGLPSRRQRLIGAWLWAGPESAIDGASACHGYGTRVDGYDADRVDVVVPFDSGLRSQSFVVVRRAMAEIEIGDRRQVPYVDAATAFIVAARGASRERGAIAVLSRGLQEGRVDIASLALARQRLGDKWCRKVDGALLAVGVGVRSPAEEDMRRLILTSQVLPEPLWNTWLELPDGGPPVCVDGLWVDAGLVNEVIGKKYHAWGEQYDDTNARKERLQAAGLIVCEATPIRIRRQAAVVLSNLEQTYFGHAGRGLPAGVRLIDPPGNRAHVRF